MVKYACRLCKMVVDATVLYRHGGSIDRPGLERISL